MSTEKMTYQDLLQIVELIKSASHFGQFHLKTGDLEVDLGRGANGAAPMPFTPSRELAAPPAQGGASAAQAAEEARAQQRHGHVGGGEIAVAPAALPQRAAPAPRAAPVHAPDAILIKSPMVGTYYRAPEPGAAPFVDIGQRVEPSTTVCVIEVMKLINSIAAGQVGVVTEILVQDGDPVEFGQLLMVIDPKQ